MWTAVVLKSSVMFTGQTRDGDDPQTVTGHAAWADPAQVFPISKSLITVTGWMFRGKPPADPCDTSSALTAQTTCVLNITPSTNTT